MALIQQDLGPYKIKTQTDIEGQPYGDKGRRRCPPTQESGPERDKPCWHLVLESSSRTGSINVLCSLPVVFVTQPELAETLNYLGDCLLQHMAQCCIFRWQSHSA